MEDTLQSIKQYEAARIEYDAYRTDLESMSTKPDGTNGLEDAQQGYEIHRQHFMKLRAEVSVKLKFLDENRVSNRYTFRNNFCNFFPNRNRSKLCTNNYCFFTTPSPRISPEIRQRWKQH